MGQRDKLPIQNFIEQARRSFMIRVRAAVGLRNNFVDDSQIPQVFRRNLHRCGCRFCFCGVAPHNRSAALRRNDRIEAVFEDVHFVTDSNRQRSARAALAGYGNNDRHRQSRHFAQIPCNGFALPALFRIDAGIRALRIHKAKDRPAELCRELHHAQSFPVTFRLRLAEIPRQALLGIAALLVTNHRHGTPVIFREPRNNGFVVREAAIPVQFHEICEEIIHIVQRVRPLLVPC